MSIILQAKTHDYGEKVYVDHVNYIHSDCGRFHVLECNKGLFWRYECYASISPYGWMKGSPPLN